MMIGRFSETPPQASKPTLPYQHGRGITGRRLPPTKVVTGSRVVQAVELRNSENTEVLEDGAISVPTTYFVPVGSV